MIPQKLEPNASAEAVCELAAQWQIDPQLAIRLHVMASIVPQQITIISGYRSPAEELALEDGIDPSISTHCSCPATGADVQVVGFSKAGAPDEVKRVLGAAAQVAGLRWGGGSSPDRMGLPTDWTHLDLGPRSR